MKTLFNISAKFKNEKGVTLVYVALLLVVFLGIAALAVDIGYLMVGKTELQRTADAAALAATRQLGVIYEGMSYTLQQSYDAAVDETLIKAAATSVALQNRAAGTSVIIDPDDIQIGKWDPTASPHFSNVTLQADAVQVVARRDDSTARISTFFYPAFAWLSSLWNKEPVDPNAGQMIVLATATAALTGPTNVGEGELKLPIGVSEKIFDKPCTDTILLSPTPNSCAGWHNFTYDHNKSDLEKTFLGLIEGHTTKDYCNGCVDNLTLGNEWLDTNFDLNKVPAPKVIPETTAPIKFDFIGGDVAALFTGVSLDGSYDTGLAPGGTPAGNYGNVIKSNGDPTTNRSNPALFETLFDYFRYRDGDGQPMEWSATVPVYEDKGEGEKCTNPSGLLKIIYFAKIIVKMPNPPPDKTITIHWDCKQSVIQGRGGGAPSNLKGSIPNLVK